MQLQFKYYGKEINKENFNKLNDVFKWVTDSTVNAVDFNSVFDGKYKSMREINDQVKKALENSSWNNWLQDFNNKFCLLELKRSDNSAEEIKTEEKDSVINKEELQSYNLYDNPNYLTHLGKKLEGVKHNKHKLPMSKLFVQFPDALQAIVLASCYGHHCYPTDTDWLNFKRVEGGSENYKDASIRHLLGGEKDKESNLPEIFHQAWNKLAELQLWLEENSIDIKEFSNNYLKNLQDKK